ncbi:hypothetical protein [Acinetobacter baumannii]|uniref:hypothetical protein n=1 Tax=Acinetobacter baumannii TaxID=470 RepID=UPI0026F6057C|nr:hypothetical protein [Acinetobacter baumannii]
MKDLKEKWLEEQGPYFCLDWVNKMEDDMLEEVTIMTPTKYEGSLAYPYLDFQPMVYTIEDFLAFAPKGKLHTSTDSILFS